MTVAAIQPIMTEQMVEKKRKGKIVTKMCVCYQLKEKNLKHSTFTSPPLCKYIKGNEKYKIKCRIISERCSITSIQRYCCQISKKPVNVTEKIRGFFATKKEKHSKADLAPIIWWKVTKRWERSYVLVTGQQCANIQWMRDELTILGF